MLIRSFFLCFVLFISFLACQSPKTETPKPSFTGHWICKNAYLAVMDSQSINRSTLPPFELVFRDGIDSVLYVNAFEMAVFPVKNIAQNQRSILGFIRDSTSNFTLSDDGNLHLISGNGQIDFFKADSSLAEVFYKKWTTTLKNFYSESLLSGQYLEGDKLLKISPLGVISGSKDYQRIELILGGDQADGSTDLAILSKTNGEQSKVAWRRVGNALRLSTAINASKPNEKPYWKAGERLVTFVEK